MTSRDALWCDNRCNIEVHHMHQTARGPLRKADLTAEIVDVSQVPTNGLMHCSKLRLHSITVRWTWMEWPSQAPRTPLVQLSASEQTVGNFFLTDQGSRCTLQRVRRDYVNAMAVDVEDDEPDDDEDDE
jgi:hypothetical protein